MMKQIGKYRIHWVLLIVLLAAFLASTFIGDVYHPWDQYLENANVGILSFEKTVGGDVDPEKLTEEDFSDRVDLMKYRIYQLLFADSSNNILHAAAQKLLSPVEDFITSISLAVGYSDIFGSNVLHFLLGIITITVYFLLFYGFQFGKNKLLDRISVPDSEVNRDSKAGKWIVRGENWAINYCVEGISAFLFLFVSYWAVVGINAIPGIPGGSFGEFLAKSKLLEIFKYLFLIALLAFFTLLVAALFICVMPYYLLMALPLLFVAWLPMWIWMPVKLFVCLLLEVFVIGYLFPKLFDKLTLWNTVGVLLRILAAIVKGIWFIPHLLLWPIRKLFGWD